VWIKRDPSQVTLLVNNIIWSAAVEEQFIKVQGGDMKAMEKYLEMSIELLTGLIKMV